MYYNEYVCAHKEYDMAHFTSYEMCHTLWMCMCTHVYTHSYRQCRLLLQQIRKILQSAKCILDKCPLYTNNFNRGTSSIV